MEPNSRLILYIILRYEALYNNFFMVKWMFGVYSYKVIIENI